MRGGHVHARGPRGQKARRSAARRSAAKIYRERPGADMPPPAQNHRERTDNARGGPPGDRRLRGRGGRRGIRAPAAAGSPRSNAQRLLFIRAILLPYLAGAIELSRVRRGLYCRCAARLIPIPAPTSPPAPLTRL